MSDGTLYGIAGACAVTLAALLVIVAWRRGWRAFGLACLTSALSAGAGVLIAELIAG